jgi:hypothetical protein
MKVAKNPDESVKNTGANNEADNQASTQPSQNAPGKQTLDDMLRENGDHYNALNSFVTAIKQFETNNYKNFSDFGRNFAASFNAYLQQSPLKEDSKMTNAYLAGLNAVLNNTSIETSKKKDYIKRAINQIMPALSSEYDQVKGALTPEHYHNMAQRSLNDPMVMFNPFANNLKQELSKDDTYGNSIKINELSRDMEKDLKNNNFSKLGEYFQKIPYNKDAYKKLKLNDKQINDMMSSADKLFSDLSADLKEEDKKRLMYSMVNILSEESNKQFSQLDKTKPADAFNNVNPDPTTGLYLALNSSKGAISPGGSGMNAENLAKILGANPYAAGADMGLQY